MRLNLNRKGQEGGLAMNQIIILVLVILVIIAVLIFLFKGDIIKYISNLPGSQSQGDKVVDVSKLPDDLKGRALCPVQLGDVRTGRDWTYFGTTSYIYLNGKATNLIWNSNSNPKVIELDEVINKDVGTIDSYDGVHIGQEWFGAAIHSSHPKLPSDSDLKMLDGAYKLWGGNKLCRSK